MGKLNTQGFTCNKCGKVINDEIEYIDNNGICDECYSIPFKKGIAIFNSLKE